MGRVDQREMVGLNGQGYSRLDGRERQPPPQYHPEMRESHLHETALGVLGEVENAKR